MSAATAKARLTVVPESAEVRTFREFLARLPAAFVECRQYGHAWSGETVEKARSTFTVTLRCLRCTSTATEVLRKNGLRDRKRVIHYVEGYLMHGLGRMTAERRAQVRVESVKRFEF